jgi:molybdenum cofactor cytidylyltransferase
MISALILAAGESKRMGTPKMLLPWGETTVLGQVIRVFNAAAINDVIVVTGGAREAVEQIAEASGARTVFNQDYASQEMLNSLQAGLHAMDPNAEAALIALGDQPQIQENTVSVIVEKYVQTGASLVVPSHRMHRGHPWLIARNLWDALFRMRSPETPRDFLHQHAQQILHIELDTPTILQDLDTLEDYLKSRQ